MGLSLSPWSSVPDDVSGSALTEPGADAEGDGAQGAPPGSSRARGRGFRLILISPTVSAEEPKFLALATTLTVGCELRHILQGWADDCPVS